MNFKMAMAGSAFILTTAGCENAYKIQQAVQIAEEANQKLAIAEAKLVQAQQQLQAERDAIKRLYTED